jgi:integrase/recombinase XerD
MVRTYPLSGGVVGAEDSQNIVTVSTRGMPDSTGLTLQERLPADRHPAAVYLARLAPGSRRTMATALDVISSLLTSSRCNMRTLDWGSLRYQHTAAIRSLLADLYAPATANKMLAALRGVLQEAWRLGQMNAEEYHRASDLPSVRGSAPPRGRALSHDEVRRLFSVCAADPTPAGRRDAALLAMLYGCGLRRSEVVQIAFDDYDIEHEALRVRHGKGRKSRITYVPQKLRPAIEAWLAIRGKVPGPLFCSINKAGKLNPKALSDQAVRKVLRKRAIQGGVAEFSPHDLRRTMIGDLLDAGADIATVQQLAGHANVTTTARYDRRGEAAKRKAADLLEVVHLPDGLVG